MKLIPKHQNKSPIKKQNWFTRATLNAAMADNPAIMTSAGWNIDSHTGDVTQDKSAFEKGAPEEKLRNSLAEISIFSPTHPLNAAFEMAPFAWRGGLYLAGKAGSKAAKNKYFATALNDAVKETNLTPALSSSSPLITRQLLPNGKIKLKLSSSTKERPREIVLDPQGNNQYYVHTRIWDGEKVPGAISNEDKKALYEALYNELPEEGEILFPQSSSNYLGTRGTVAGLKRLSRDPRYRPGNQTGTLYFEDKNNTINTFTGTSFIKKGLSQSNPRTSLAFFERPSKLTIAEKLGKPKVERTPIRHGEAKAPYYDYSLINRNYEPWIVNENGEFVFKSPKEAKRLATIHFSFNSPVTAHSGGSWNDAPTTVIIPYKNIRSKVAPVDILIYDTFFPNYNGLKFSSRGSKILTGDKFTFDYYKNKGLDVEFSKEIESEIQKLKSIEAQLNKMPKEKRYSVIGEYPDVDELNKEYQIIADNIDNIVRNWVIKNRKPIPDYEHVLQLGKSEGYNVNKYPYLLAHPRGLNPQTYEPSLNSEMLPYDWVSDPSNHSGFLDSGPEVLSEVLSDPEIRPQYKEFIEYLLKNKGDYR